MKVMTLVLDKLGLGAWQTQEACTPSWYFTPRVWDLEEKTGLVQVSHHQCHTVVKI